MPALSNPRYERFAQALFAGLAGETRVKRAQSTAYLTAYPNCSNGNSAEAAASRLLRRVKPILVRVHELQAESMARQQHSIDLSRAHSLRPWSRSRLRSVRALRDISFQHVVRPLGDGTEFHPLILQMCSMCSHNVVQ